MVSKFTWTEKRNIVVNGRVRRDKHMGWNTPYTKGVQRKSHETHQRRRL
jgi:hypothetical protein